MTPLRLQMIEDMKSAGLAPRTQAVYIDAVRRPAAHYRRSPDQLSEDEVRRRPEALTCSPPPPPRRQSHLKSP
jgi:Phage integrase, N-terminal SAM-like domain